ncbi:MAG: hypothetical protein HY244_06060 [Rhizobiales bacterium]|nr:hypothetical protein [Hyphomicrobiales bacterium]
MRSYGSYLLLRSAHDVGRPQVSSLRWQWAAAVAVIASFAGDIIAYGIGRAVSENFPRALTSSLSSIVSLLAGVGRYGFARFMSFAAVGRLIWTSAMASAATSRRPASSSAI